MPDFEFESDFADAENFEEIPFGGSDDGFADIPLEAALGEIGESPAKQSSVKESKKQESPPPPRLESTIEKKVAHDIKPPAKNDMEVMVRTFQDVATGMVELAQVGHVVCSEMKKAQEEASKYTSDAAEMAEYYNKARSDLQKTITETYQFFELGKTIISDFANQKKNIAAMFTEATAKFDATQNAHELEVKKYLIQLETKLKHISDSVEVKQVSQEIRESIQETIKMHGLADFNALVQKIEGAIGLLNHKATHLLGDPNANKLGVVDRFSRHADKLSKAIEQTSSHIKYRFLLFGGVMGIIAGLGIGYAAAIDLHKKNLSAEIGSHVHRIDEEYRSRFNELNEKLLAYREIERRGMLRDGVVGFGFYADTKTPYFYFPKTFPATVVNGDKVIVEIQ